MLTRRQASISPLILVWRRKPRLLLVSNIGASLMGWEPLITTVLPHAPDEHELLILKYREGRLGVTGKKGSVGDTILSIVTEMLSDGAELVSGQISLPAQPVVHINATIITLVATTEGIGTGKVLVTGPLARSYSEFLRKQSAYISIFQNILPSLTQATPSSVSHPVATNVLNKALSAGADNIRRWGPREMALLLKVIRDIPEHVSVSNGRISTYGIPLSDLARLLDFRDIVESGGPLAEDFISAVFSNLVVFLDKRKPGVFTPLTSYYRYMINLTGSSPNQLKRNLHKIGVLRHLLSIVDTEIGTSAITALGPLLSGASDNVDDIVAAEILSIIFEGDVDPIKKYAEGRFVIDPEKITFEDALLLRYLGCTSKGEDIVCETEEVLNRYMDTTKLLDIEDNLYREPLREWLLILALEDAGLLFYDQKNKTIILREECGRTSLHLWRSLAMARESETYLKRYFELPPEIKQELATVMSVLVALNTESVKVTKTRKEENKVITRIRINGEPAVAVLTSARFVPLFVPEDADIPATAMFPEIIVALAASKLVKHRKLPLSMPVLSSRKKEGIVRFGNVTVITKEPEHLKKTKEMFDKLIRLVHRDSRLFSRPTAIFKVATKDWKKMEDIAEAAVGILWGNLKPRVDNDGNVKIGNVYIDELATTLKHEEIVKDILVKVVAAFKDDIAKKLVDVPPSTHNDFIEVSVEEDEPDFGVGDIRRFLLPETFAGVPRKKEDMIAFFALNMTLGSHNLGIVTKYRDGVVEVAGIPNKESVLPWIRFVKIAKKNGCRTSLAHITCREEAVWRSIKEYLNTREVELGLDDVVDGLVTIARVDKRATTIIKEIAEQIKLGAKVIRLDERYFMKVTFIPYCVECRDRAENDMLRKFFQALLDVARLNAVVLGHLRMLQKATGSVA